MNTIHHEIFKHGCISLLFDGYYYAVAILYHRFVNGNELKMYRRCEVFKGVNSSVKARLCYLNMREYLGTLEVTVK